MTFLIQFFPSMLIDLANYMVCSPIQEDGCCFFAGYTLAGARATHGFTAGRVGFQVKLLDNLDARVVLKSLSLLNK